MTSWKDLYKNGLFSINTSQPSKLVAEYAKLIPANSRVIDFGCGAGRNSIYLATQNHSVDAVDVVDLDWRKNIDSKIRNKISFTQTDLKTNICIKHVYGATVLIRLLQYLPPETVSNLFKEVVPALVPNGLIIGSYNTRQGKKINGSFDATGVELYCHTPDFIKSIAENHGLLTIKFEVFETISQHVMYKTKIKVCEFVFKKL